MSKKLMLVIVAGMVIVGGYFILKSPNVVESPVIQNEEPSTESSGKKMAFSELIAQKGSYKCEVKQYLSDFENVGTVYMNGENLSGSFSTVAEGRNMESYFIMKDGYMYNWSSFAPNMGIKIKAQANGQAESKDAYSWSAEQIGDYNCEIWTVDESKFALPAGVTFTTIDPK